MLDLKKMTCNDPISLLYLLSIKRPESQKYLILESYVECLSKAVHVLDFSKKSIYDVGRCDTNDVTVSDITVSRFQATVQLQA